MKWIHVICLLGWIAAGVQAAAGPSPAGRRFLLVVEASSASAKCSAGVENAARQLVGGAFGGKMRRGDTLGVWVYGESADMGFPMLVWNPSEVWPVSQRIVEHLRQRKWSQMPIWENVRTALWRVVGNSEDLTVAVISSPESRLSTGAGFDGRIAAIYAESGLDLSRNKLPFVTFFAVRNGKLVDAAVNSGIGPWTIPDPPVPPRPQPEPALQAKAPVKAAAKRRPPPDVLPPAFASSNEAQVLAAVAASPVARETVGGTAAPVSAGGGRPVAATTTTIKPALRVEPLPPAKSPDPVPVAGPETAVVKSLVPAVAAVEPAGTLPVPALFEPQTVEPEPTRRLQTPAVVFRPIVQSARVVTSADPSGAGFFAGGVGSMLLAAGTLWWFLGRRRNTNAPVSLITQSLDRH